MANDGEAQNPARKVRVGVGMGVDEFVMASTYPLESQIVDFAGEFQAVQITEPYHLELLDGEAILDLGRLGGPNELTSITLKDGKVADLVVTLQNGRTDLHGAMSQAGSLHEWFEQRGYKEGPDDRMFVIQQSNGPAKTALISTFEGAEKAFMDPRLKLSEVQLFGLQKGDVGVGVSLYNTRRMRAAQSKEFDDESNAATERSYMLTMYITQVSKF